MKITNMHQGGWDISNNPSANNGSNVYTGASEITIAAEYGQTTVTFLNKINYELLSGESIANNHRDGGGNVNNSSKI